MDFFIDLIQYTGDGALKGMLYALIAMGFIVIYRAGRILNFGQGEVVVVGGFLIYTFMALPFFPNLVTSVLGEVPLWFSIILSLISAGSSGHPYARSCMMRSHSSTIAALNMLTSCLNRCRSVSVKLIPAQPPLSAARRSTWRPGRC